LLDKNAVQTGRLPSIRKTGGYSIKPKISLELAMAQHGENAL
jgi:hypothetical protein